MSIKNNGKGELIDSIFSYLFLKYQENSFSSTLIASDLNSSIASVRNSLIRMREQNLVECRNQAMTNTRRYLYRHKPPARTDPLLGFGINLKQH